MVDPDSLSGFGSLLGLLPAWSGKLIWKWENDFIWEIIDSPEELNVLIMVEQYRNLKQVQDTKRAD